MGAGGTFLARDDGVWHAGDQPAASLLKSPHGLLATWLVTMVACILLTGLKAAPDPPFPVLGRRPRMRRIAPHRAMLETERSEDETRIHEMQVARPAASPSRHPAHTRHTASNIDSLDRQPATGERPPGPASGRRLSHADHPQRQHPLDLLQER
jgi:hypothetical protein